MSSCGDQLSSPSAPVFVNHKPATESPAAQRIIGTLKLQDNPEGGFFVETDRDQRQVPNPFEGHAANDSTRSASTTIYYFLTPASAKGSFHRNKGRIIHTLHKGRGRYVLIHADEAGPGQKARIETFVVGQDIGAGERLQWIVEGGKYKASFLLPDIDGTMESDGLLISETVVPGFDYKDHDFMPAERLPELVSERQSKELEWLLLDSDRKVVG